MNNDTRVNAMSVNMSKCEEYKCERLVIYFLVFTVQEYLDEQRINFFLCYLNQGYLTNSKAYETYRFNAAFTRALQ